MAHLYVTDVDWIGNMNTNTKVTKSTLEVDKTLAMGTCCEPDCGMSILVDKSDKDSGRQVRCTACLMRVKTGIKPAR